LAIVATRPQGVPMSVLAAAATIKEGSWPGESQ
jgi:hypothetical protein